MAGRERLEELLGELGRKTGLGTLALDSNGVCALGFGEELTLHLFAEDGAERTLLYVPLGPLPAERRHELQQAMLEANLRDDLPGALGLDHRTGEAMLACRIRLEEIDYSTFEQLLERLVAAGLTWQAELARGGSGSPPVPVSDQRIIMGLGIRA
jgi:hypothetical protein